ncbi:MAG TPA: hypothetical protein VGI47_07300, partial [Candidatus Binataceae bacterium]
MARQEVETSRRGELIPTRVAPWLVSMAVVAVGAGWLGWHLRVANDPSRLIAKAYTQQRPFEFRIAGAGHAAVRLERAAAGSHFQRPSELLEAEARIARELENDPSSRRWLQLRARAELLAWDPDTAIATLERAQAQEPGDPSLLADVGVAYALRAEAQNRAVDYGYAIEYLSRSLKATPNSPEAVFNRAVVYDRMYLYEDGALEWRRYLEVERDGAWREEARRRLDELERKRRVRQTALARISDRPELLLQRIAGGDDVEPESYLDLVVTEWLPNRWNNPNYERALSALAARFDSRHSDPWLRDVLATPRSDRLALGLAALAEALKANLADESDRALVKAPEAARDLRATGDRAGALRADLEHAYALHRAVEGAPECLQKAVDVEKNARAMKYAWILGQATLEEGNCRSLLGDFDAAHRDMDRASAQVAQAGYRDLELRAAAITQELQTDSGN